MMRLREPFIKKHVHQWTETRGSHKDPVYDEWGFQVADSGVLHRKCTDCGCKQSAEKKDTELNGLPESVWHLADLEWK